LERGKERETEGEKAWIQILSPSLTGMCDPTPLNLKVFVLPKQKNVLEGLNEIPCTMPSVADGKRGWLINVPAVIISFAQRPAGE